MQNTALQKIMKDANNLVCICMYICTHLNLGGIKAT